MVSVQNPPSPPFLIPVCPSILYHIGPALAYPCKDHARDRPKQFGSSFNEMRMAVAERKMTTNEK
jgi:hypothetical protein